MITGRSRANTKAGTYELLIRLPLVMEMIVMSGIMTEIRPGMEKPQKALDEIHEPPESRGLDSVCRLAEQLRKIPIQPDLTENIRLIAENIIVAAGIARGDLAKAKRKFEKEIRRKSDGDDHGQYGDLT